VSDKGLRVLSPGDALRLDEIAIDAFDLVDDPLPRVVGERLLVAGLSHPGPPLRVGEELQDGRGDILRIVGIREEAVTSLVDDATGGVDPPPEDRAAAHPGLQIRDAEGLGHRRHGEDVKAVEDARLVNLFESAHFDHAASFILAELPGRVIHVAVGLEAGERREDGVAAFLLIVKSSPTYSLLSR